MCLAGMSKGQGTECNFSVTCHQDSDCIVVCGGFNFPPSSARCIFSQIPHCCCVA